MKTVLLATFNNSSQASILQSVLSNEGIEYFIKNGVVSSILNTPGFQIEVEVSEDDYERALEILKKGFPYLVDQPKHT